MTDSELTQRIEQLELNYKKLSSLLGVSSISDVDFTLLDLPDSLNEPLLKSFRDFVANKLYLLFLTSEISAFGLLKSDTKSASDKFYVHLNKIITSIPAIGTVFKGLETGEVAASINNEKTNEFNSLFPVDIPNGFAPPFPIETTSIELKRRLQANYIATELTKQYAEPLKQLDESSIFIAARYATYAIGSYLIYYLARKAKNKSVYPLSISNITDAVALHRKDNFFAQCKIKLVSLKHTYIRPVNELFSDVGIQYEAHCFSCDPKDYRQYDDKKPNGLAILYGYRQLNEKHAYSFMQQVQFQVWHEDKQPLNQLPDNEKNQKIALFQTKTVSQDILATLTPSRQKISRALVRLMSFILFISSLMLIVLGIAAVRESGFLNDSFASVTSALGLDTFSGSLMLGVGIALISLLTMTYLCLWLNDEKSPITPSNQPIPDSSSSDEKGSRQIGNNNQSPSEPLLSNTPASESPLPKKTASSTSPHTLPSNELRKTF